MKYILMQLSTRFPLRVTFLVFFTVNILTHWAYSQVEQIAKCESTEILSIKVSPSGYFLAGISRSGKISILTTDSLKILSQISLEKSQPKQIEFIRNDTELLVSDKNGRLFIYDVVNGVKKITFKTNSYSTTEVHYDASRDEILSYHKTIGTIKIWKSNSSKPIKYYKIENPYSYNLLKFLNTKGNSIFFSQTKSNFPLTINYETNETKIRGSKQIGPVELLSKHGNSIITFSEGNVIDVYNISDGETKTYTLNQHTPPPKPIGFSTNNKLIAIRDFNDHSLIKILDIENRELSKTINFNSNYGFPMTFQSGPNSKFLFEGTSKGYIRKWLWGSIFPKLVKEQVEKGLANWQKKGRYEKTEDYKNRLSESNRSKFLKSYISIVIDSLGEVNFEREIKKLNYDADNEIFELIYSNNTHIYLSVPVDEAPSFDKNRNLLEYFKMDFGLNEEGEFFLIKAILKNPDIGKNYTFDSGKELQFKEDKFDVELAPISVEINSSQQYLNIIKNSKTHEIGFSDIEKDIPQSEKSNPDAIAVIIGNKNYLGDIPKVEFAHNDALTIRKYIEQTFGYKPGNILYSEDATLSEMKLLLGDERYPGKLGNYVKKGMSDVFIFYSGHGAPEVNSQTGFLMPVNANPGAIGITGYPIETLYNNLSKLEARSLTVVIDACFSGSSGSGKMLIENASPVGIRVSNPAAKIENSIIISASQGDQIASWYPEKGHGLLTYFYLKGLKGDADLDNNGQITSVELQNYLQDKTNGVPYWARRLHGRDQSPEVISVEEIAILGEPKEE